MIDTGVVPEGRSCLYPVLYMGPSRPHFPLQSQKCSLYRFLDPYTHLNSIYLTLTLLSITTPFLSCNLLLQGYCCENIIP